MTLEIADLPGNFIGGEWIVPASAATIPVINPSTLEQIGVVPDLDVTSSLQAVDAADAAATDWAAMPAVEREAILLKAAALFERHREDLARIITTEQGKPLEESRGEIDYGINFVRWYAAEGRRLYGEIVPSPDPAKRLLVFREPVGPTLLISAGNDPFAMITRKGSPALAAGCPLVVKPHRETPFSALATARLFAEAGLPAGVMNVVTTTRSSEVCDAILAHPALRHITFTGSSAVGKILGARAGGLMKGMTMELGGHAPFVVFEDADLDLAAADLLSRKFTNAGQTCSCPARIFLQDAIANAFIDRFGDGVQNLVVGDGMDPSVTMGPLQNKDAVGKTERHIEDALGKGAKLLLGGRRINDRVGHYHAPTVLRDTTTDMSIMYEETFGPVAALVTFSDEADLMSRVNHATYGLTGYCYTQDLSRAFRMAAGFRCGFVGINDRRPQGAEVPMGGVRESGMGREGGHWGLEEFTTIKYVSIRT